MAVLHSNRTQRERIEALEGFKSGKYEVMVATDIAARGLDIAGVIHVINYDVPRHPEDYVHRIGRTGRAQKVGDAFTIFTAEEIDHVRAIERFIGTKVPRLKLDGFRLTSTPRSSTRTTSPRAASAKACARCAVTALADANAADAKCNKGPRQRGKDRPHRAPGQVSG